MDTMKMNALKVMLEQAGLPSLIIDLERAIASKDGPGIASIMGKVELQKIKAMSDRKIRIKAKPRKPSAISKIASAMKDGDANRLHFTASKAAKRFVWSK